MAPSTVTLGSRTNDLTGAKFGHLTVIGPTGERAERYVVWECRCVCGTMVRMASNLLQRKRDHAHCGCQHITKQCPAEYRVWTDMRTRCNNPNSNRYARYGARGIRVCERWNSFANFLTDMGHRPSPEFSIEREDNNGDYEPDNCRWATTKEQSRNMSRNRMLTYDGKTMCLADWAVHTGIDSDLIGGRLNALGWSVERALTTPNDHRPGRKTA